MKIDRVKVDKGVSVEVAENVWDKTNYGLEASLDAPDEHEQARAKLEQIIDGWIKSSKTWISPEEHGRRVSQKSEKNEPSEQSFEGLPWMSFKTKEPCQENEAGWIFRAASPRLAERLDPKGVKWVQIGMIMEYRLSGKDLNFINRRPIKKEAARR